MAELSIDLTYGTALYQAAEERGLKKEVLEELKMIKQLLDEEPGFRELLKSPAVSAEEKKAVIGEAFETRISQETVNFLYILMDKGRFTHLDRIIRVYNSMYEKGEGIIRGTIYSVEPLSPEKLEQFQIKTGKLMGGEVMLENLTDESLIGGVRIMVNGKIIDASIRNGLKKLASEMRL